MWCVYVGCVANSVSRDIVIIALWEFLLSLIHRSQFPPRSPLVVAVSDYISVAPQPLRHGRKVSQLFVCRLSTQTFPNHKAIVRVGLRQVVLTILNIISGPTTTKPSSCLHTNEWQSSSIIWQRTTRDRTLLWRSIQQHCGPEERGICML